MFRIEVKYRRNTFEGDKVRKRRVMLALHALIFEIPLILICAVAVIFALSIFCLWVYTLNKFIRELHAREAEYGRPSPRGRIRSREEIEELRDQYHEYWKTMKNYQLKKQLKNVS